MTKRLNPNKYIYSGNLHEIYGNILPLPALDIVNEKQNYWDFSTGFMIYVPWERHYREFMHNFIGFSVNHFTRPKDNFIEENARIPIKLSLQWNSFIRTSLYSLDKKVVYMFVRDYYMKTEEIDYYLPPHSITLSSVRISPPIPYSVEYGIVLSS